MKKENKLLICLILAVFKERQQMSSVKDIFKRLAKSGENEGM